VDKEECLYTHFLLLNGKQHIQQSTVVKKKQIIILDELLLKLEECLYTHLHVQLLKLEKMLKTI
jgi:hypothetical protein